VAELDGEVIIASRSLFAETLPDIDFDELELNNDGSVSFYSIGPANNTLRLVARNITTDQHAPVTVVVAGNASDIQKDIAQFRQRVFLTLAVLGLALAISTFVQVKWGLQPLRRIAQGLSDIREGRSQDLQGSFPTEIQPLVSELNALIGFNKKVIKRARTHVGNLAHALKTPISVLRNEARDYETPLSEMVVEQTNAMQSQVNYHLDRAQVIARRGVLSAANPVKPTLDGLIRAMNKIYGDKNLTITQNVEAGLRFAGERRDLEEALGNLIDNLSIEDDGPGLTEEEQEQARKRGERLDEQTPGSGLGLSIVHDLVNAYDGSFSMGRSELGGLSAVLLFK